MTDTEITALAREYAEEIVDHKRLSTTVADDTEDVIRFLLRRFCLVEKSKVKNIHKGILVQLDPKSFGYSPYNQGRMDVMKSLFPEIAKEVEG